MIVPNADIITVRRKRARPGRGKVIFFGIRSSVFVSENQGNQNRRITETAALGCVDMLLLSAKQLTGAEGEAHNIDRILGLLLDLAQHVEYSFAP